MRLIKMLGLVTVAAMAAMAFVGATSASADSAQLCNSHTALTCGSAATTVSMVNSGSGRFLTSLLDVICDDVNATGTPLALGNPQSVHVSGLDFSSCETNEGDGCVVTVLTQPLADLNKTGLDAGILTDLSGSVLVNCEDVNIWFDMHCVLDLTGSQFSVGAQKLHAKETRLDKSSGSSLCPDEGFLDGLLVPTGSRYVLA